MHFRSVNQHDSASSLMKYDSLMHGRNGHQSSQSQQRYFTPPSLFKLQLHIKDLDMYQRSCIKMLCSWTGEDTIEGQRVQQRMQSQNQVSDRFSRVKGLLSVDRGGLVGSWSVVGITFAGAENTRHGIERERGALIFNAPLFARRAIGRDDFGRGSTAACRQERGG